MRRLTDWYRYPRYYEAIFGRDTEQELDFLEQINGWFGTGGRIWLEPACGSGRLVAGAVRRGYTVIGYDVSETMLEHARGRLKAIPGLGSRAYLFRGRMESFCPAAWRGRIDMAFCLLSTFRYLSTDEAALDHLEAVHRLLRPGGAYALGFHLTDYSRRRPERERWVAPLGRERIVCNTREWPADRRLRRARMRNRLRVEGPRGTRLVETEWHFRTWNEDEALALFRRARLELRAAYGFDGDLTRPLRWDSPRLDRVMILSPRK
jgi:SAM-dependent methyltransferase